eukprot:gene5641-39786_t
MAPYVDKGPSRASPLRASRSRPANARRRAMRATAGTFSAL